MLLRHVLALCFLCLVLYLDEVLLLRFGFAFWLDVFALLFNFAFLSCVLLGFGLALCSCVAVLCLDLAS